MSVGGFFYVFRLALIVRRQIKEKRSVNIVKIKRFFQKQKIFWFFLNSFFLRSTIVVAERKTNPSVGRNVFLSVSVSDGFSLKISSCVVATGNGA